jgi:UDP-N-acetylmuramyl pentapeptide phosphotransferase/UDP-N-acetylglucosamine-1-phosphate transferase
MNASNHGDLKGVQKFNFEPTPRILGIPVFVGFFVGLWFVDLPEGFYLAILFASLLVFGLTGDITARISSRLRMLATLRLV